MTPCFTAAGMIDLDAPDWTGIDMRRVATRLASLYRFGDGLARRVSVAEHSLVVAGLAPRRLKLAALLHDCHEVAIGDIPRPLENWFAERGFIGFAPALEGLRHRLDAAFVRAALEWAEVEDVDARVAEIVDGMRDPACVAADQAAGAWELKYCGPRQTDWPERALYDRMEPSAHDVGQQWLMAALLMALCPPGAEAAP